MNNQPIQDYLSANSAEQLKDLLSPYVTDARKKRIASVLSKRLHTVTIAVEAPSDPHNAAAIMRTAEAFGLLRAHVITSEGISVAARKTTQGAFHWLDIRYHTTIDALRTDLADFTIAGACVDGELTLEEIPIDKPLCLLLGNEQRGLTENAKKCCDKLYTIPMVGMSESINLSVAAGISLYDVVTRTRKNLSRDTDLNAEQMAVQQALYYAHSVPKKLLEGLLASK